MSDKHIKNEQLYNTQSAIKNLTQGDTLPESLACIQMDEIVDLCADVYFRKPPPLQQNGWFIDSPYPNQCIV